MDWDDDDLHYDDDEEEEEDMGRKVVHTGSGLKGTVRGNAGGAGGYLWVELEDGSRSLIHSSELKDA